MLCAMREPGEAIYRGKLSYYQRTGQKRIDLSYTHPLVHEQICNESCDKEHEHQHVPECMVILSLLPDVVGQILEIGAVPRRLNGSEDAWLLGRDVVVPRNTESVTIDGVVACLDLRRRAMNVGQIRTVPTLMDDRIGRPRHHVRQQHLLTLHLTKQVFVLKKKK